MSLAVFVPKRVLIEPDALDYQLGQELRDRFRDAGAAVAILPESNRVSGLPGDTPAAAYREAKQTLVIAVRRTLRFQTCKPSAHYQLPLVTSCPGMCEYCYLQTTLGRRPVIRAYVNLDEILAEAKRLIIARAPDVTVFEGAATADPLPIERYTGGLARAIAFFGDEEHGRFRFVTKFSDVASLLPLSHQGHTRFRFSINIERVIAAYEHNTAPLAERIAAAAQTAAAGYPIGFLVAPIFFEGDWRAEYSQLLTDLQRALAPIHAPDVTFELITHRFTARAKANISAVFPQTTLPLDAATRQFKYGQFGYGKYLYPADERAEAKAFLTDTIARLFPQGRVEYLV
jgi:spore photoproduct lyase